MKCGESVDSLLDTVYPGITVLDPKENNDQYFLERTILNARNDDVDELNDKVLQRLNGPVITFCGADSVVTERGVDGDVQYLVEYLNTINVSGLPLAKLKLKLGAPIMILSVAEVQFRTGPENWNRQNRTESLVLFSSGS